MNDGQMVHHFSDEFSWGRWWPPAGWPRPYTPFWVAYSRTDNSDILNIRSERRLRKEDVKVRFIEPDRIEIEVQRRPAGEEIPVE